MGSPIGGLPVDLLQVDPCKRVEMSVSNDGVAKAEKGVSEPAEFHLVRDNALIGGQLGLERKGLIIGELVLGDDLASFIDALGRNH